ncbi:MAG TPA: PfkB family carbohydrate kinase [Candidatus Izemoplasmatales bacterium]|nr:PfkB family carbohydrate kinase [Bacillota bacterium]HRY77527.1 PfkB family carbohydrate kinase [Candidatus Izemoplasmatales bacterium]
MGKILVIGSANVDLIGVGNQKLIPHDSNIGRIDLMVGGVGKNIAENLKLLQSDVGFLTFLGNDAFAKIVTDHLDRLGLDYGRSLWLDRPSGKYLAIHEPNGSLDSAVNDTALMDEIPLSEMEQRADYIAEFDTLVLDTNLPVSLLDWLFYRFSDKQIVVDGVCRAKVLRILPHLGNISLLKVNRQELEALLGKPVDDIILSVRDLVAKGMKQIIVTNGTEPITYNIDRRIYQTAIFEAKIVRSSVGCGDAFLAATVYGLSRGFNMHESVNLGKKAAALTMEVYTPVNPAIQTELIHE